MAGYKTNTQNLVAFLYTNDKQTEKDTLEIKQPENKLNTGKIHNQVKKRLLK